MSFFPIKKFMMIRHGESVANVENWAAGVVDTPLTAKGRAQAEQARHVLEAMDEKPVRIVHSPLSRAKETAKILNRRLRLPMGENGHIGEQNFGAWAGHPWEDVARRLDAGDVPPDGESTAVFTQRAVAGLKTALAEEGLTLIVSHGHVMDALGAAYGLERLHSQNCQFYLFEPSGEQAVFPWRIWHFSSGSQGLIRTRHHSAGKC